jgi:glycosyltransferase involved in cell wall biosynthesis
MTVGMALYSDLTYDSRVQREAAALARAGYRVRLVCLAAPAGSTDLPPGVEVLVHRPTRTAVLPGTQMAVRDGRWSRIPFVRRAAWLRAYVGNLRAWGRSVPAVVGPVDGWHLHDLTALAGVLPAIDHGLPVVYDAHELFTESGTVATLPRPVRLALRAHEGRLVSRVSAVVTVNDALAGILRDRYRPGRLIVVHNCPDTWDQPARRPDRLREAAGIPATSPVILYHGVLGDHRGIAQLMRALLEPGMAGAHLALLGPGALRDELVAEAEDPRWQGRVHVLDPVRPVDLLPWVASADVGAMPIQGTTPNLYMSTPNKLFECLAAGVPVIVSDFPAMRRIVLDDAAGPLGAVCDPADPADVAAALRSILEMAPEALAAMRSRCLSAARRRWNWAHESQGLIALYSDLLGGGR